MFLIFAVNISTAAASCTVGLITAIILYRIFRYKEYPDVDRKLACLFAVYFILQIIIAALSINPLVSFREVVGEIHRCFPLFFAMLYIKTKDHLKYILLAFMFSVLLNNIFGEIQYFVFHLDRTFAFAHTPTFYASFLLMQLPILIWIITLDFMPAWSKRLDIIIIITSLQMLIATVTRGVWLAFMVTGIVFIILDERWRQKSIKYLITVFVISLAIIAFTPHLQSRAVTLWNPDYTSNSERILMWKSSIEIIKDYPIHGIGQKMFQMVYNLHYISENARERPPAGTYESGHTHPHNNIFNVTTEGGIIGLFAFVMLHGYFFRRLYDLHKNERKHLKLTCGMVGFIVLLALQLEGLTDTNMNQVPIMREYWFLIGMLLVSGNILQNRKL